MRYTVWRTRSRFNARVGPWCIPAGREWPWQPVWRCVLPSARKRGTNAAYAVCCGALLLISLLPVATFILLPPSSTVIATLSLIPPHSAEKPPRRPTNNVSVEVCTYAREVESACAEGVRSSIDDGRPCLTLPRNARR